MIIDLWNNIFSLYAAYSSNIYSSTAGMEMKEAPSIAEPTEVKTTLDDETEPKKVEPA